MISVIIPVYNSGRFLRQSVESALSQKETGEVILVEDASPDNSYKICLALEKEHEKVKLFTHPGHINLGAAATRNLAIEKCTQDYVAFLDADDYFLANRFKKAVELFNKYEEIDGVGDAVGVFFENEQAKNLWQELGREQLTTTATPLTPETFFDQQSPIGFSGQIHTNGWTLKRSIFKKSGLFNPTLRLHQDTELFIRLAIASKLYTGEIAEPVAMRRVHEDNRITAKRTPEVNFNNRLNMWLSAWTWAKKNGYASEATVIMTRFIHFIYEINKSPRGYLKNIRSTIRLHPILLSSLSFHTAAISSLLDILRKKLKTD